MESDAERNRPIDRRMEGLRHRARRIVPEVSVPEAAMHPPTLTVEIAAVMARLKAAETIAQATDPRKER